MCASGDGGGWQRTGVGHDVAICIGGSDLLIDIQTAPYHSDWQDTFGRTNGDRDQD